MNLCGVPGASTDVDLLIHSVLTSGSSDDDHAGFSPSPRLKLPRSPSPNRQKRGSSSNKYSRETMSATPSARQKAANLLSSTVPARTTLLNPLSLETLTLESPSKSQQRTVAHRQQQSLLITKLENGYRVILYPSKRNTPKLRNVFLDLDPGRIHLRINARGGESSSGVYKSTPTVLRRLRVKDIVRLEIGRIERKMPHGDTKSEQLEPVKSFMIVITGIDQEVKLYHFEAQSMLERDDIIAALKLIMRDRSTANRLTIEPESPAEEDQQPGHIPPTSPKGTLSPMKRTHIHSGTPTSKRVTSKPARTPCEQGTETSLVYFDFDQIPDSEPEQHQPQPHSQSQNTIALPALGNHRSASPFILDRRPHGGKNGTRHSRRHKSSDDSRENANDTPVDHSERRERRLPISDSCDSDSFERGIRKSSNYSIGTADGSFDTYRVSPTRGGSISGLHRNDITESSTSHGIHRTTSNAITVSDETELATIANQLAEPWCTDDVCTMALNDFADACRGVFLMKHTTSSTNEPKSPRKNEDQQELMTDYMSGTLAAPGHVVSFLSSGDVWNSGPSNRGQNNATRAAIRNRASRRHGQAKRLEALRATMIFSGTSAPFHGDMLHLQTARSFDDTEREQKMGGKERRLAQMRREIEMPSIFDQMVGNTGTEAASDIRTGEDVLYYDSDPESYKDAKIQTNLRRIPVPSSSVASSKMHQDGRRRRKVPSHGTDSSSLVHPRHWKSLEESEVSQLIEAMKNEQLTLVWHPQTTDKHANKPPVCVKVWIETGVYLVDGSFLLPKLTWIPINEKGLESRRLNISDGPPSQLDLLDVCRIRAPASVNRSVYPFARQGKSFVIQTQDEAFLFEARSSEERDRLVDGMKLLIARLASLLMLRDLRAVEEFFGCGSVPGEAPTWAK